MSDTSTDTASERDPYRVLGLPRGAGADEIRAAYLARVRDYPPDRSPSEFERIRDAYDALRDPRRRAQSLLFRVDPAAPLVSLLDELPPERAFVGPGPWLAAMKKEEQP